MKLEFSTETVFELINVFNRPGFQRLKDSLLAIMLGQKDELFEKSQGPDDTAWAPLSPKTLKRKQAKAAKNSKSTTNTTWGSPKILVDTGALQNSLSIKGGPNSFQSTTGNEVVIGSNLPYAKRMNYGFGATPARPFIGFSRSDYADVREKIVSYMNRGGE